MGNQAQSRPSKIAENLSARPHERLNEAQCSPSSPISRANMEAKMTTRFFGI